MKEIEENQVRLVSTKVNVSKYWKVLFGAEISLLGIKNSVESVLFASKVSYVKLEERKSSSFTPRPVIFRTVRATEPVAVIYKATFSP